MSSIILRVTARGLLPLAIMFSFFLLLRGHNEPGGGFVGGLSAAAAVALYAYAFGVPAARGLLRVPPERLAAAGVLVAVASALLGPVLGLPFMQGLWWGAPLPVLGKVGTPVLFDAGVYLAVFGVMLAVIFDLMEC